jgi:hypothetical protein
MSRLNTLRKKDTKIGRDLAEIPDVSCHDHLTSSFFSQDNMQCILPVL